jgi:hypothetical protein
VAHSCEPKANPSSGFANRRWLSPALEPAGPLEASGTGGAGMPVQDAPPSVVRTIEVHGWTAHGAVPRTQPSLADTNVIDTGSNPAGTGPPAGPTGPAGDVAATGAAAGGVRAGAAALVRGCPLAADMRGDRAVAEQPAASAVAQIAMAVIATRRAAGRPARLGDALAPGG